MPNPENQQLIDEIKSSRMFELIEQPVQESLLIAITKAPVDSLPALREKFLKDEDELKVMDKEIEENEAQKKALIEKRERFKRELAERVAKERAESEKKAAEILESLENL